MSLNIIKTKSTPWKTMNGSFETNMKCKVKLLSANLLINSSNVAQT